MTVTRKRAVFSRKIFWGDHFLFVVLLAACTPPTTVPDRGSEPGASSAGTPTAQSGPTDISTPEPTAFFTPVPIRRVEQISVSKLASIDLDMQIEEFPVPIAIFLGVLNCGPGCLQTRRSEFRRGWESGLANLRDEQIGRGMTFIKINGCVIQVA